MTIRDVLAYVVGYAFTVIIGQAVIYPLMAFLLQKIGEQEQREFLWLAAGVGIVERVIYTTSVVLGQYELMAIWLVLKAAVEWKSEEKRNLSSFYVYLIGNGMSIIFGYLGGVVVLALK